MMIMVNWEITFSVFMALIIFGIFNMILGLFIGE